jgi:hypothetical protein
VIQGSGSTSGCTAVGIFHLISNRNYFVRKYRFDWEYLGRCSVTWICSRTRIWPACVIFHAADHTQFEFLFSVGCVTV